MVRSQDNLTIVASEIDFSNQQRISYQQAAGVIPAASSIPSIHYALSEVFHYSLKRNSAPPPEIYLHTGIRFLQSVHGSHLARTTMPANVDRQWHQTVCRGRVCHTAAGFAGGGIARRFATPCGAGEAHRKNWKNNNEAVLRFYRPSSPVFRGRIASCCFPFSGCNVFSLDFCFGTYIMLLMGRFWIYIDRFIIQSQGFNLLKGLICGRYPQVFAFRKVKYFPP